MKWIAAFIAGLMLSCIVRADELDDELAKYAAKTDAMKAKPKVMQKACDCGGDPTQCICGPCDCAGGRSCRLQAAPANTFLHDCGCPSAQCNCNNDCHCAPNRAVNRQPSRWVRDSGYWYLYRGSQCLGVMKVNGTQFFQWNGSDWNPTPMKPPSVPPYRQEQTMVQASPVCRS